MERRRGRRDNGLDATDFAAVGDLDPRLAEHLLDLLAAHGIAAYLQPSMDVNPITRSSTVPARPTDRLYADRTHLRTARDFLRRLIDEEDSDTTGPGDPPDPAGPPVADQDDQHPQPPTTAGPAAAPTGVDATFAGIIAGFDRPVDPTAAAWPAAENVARGAAEPSSPAAPPPPPSPPADARHLTQDSLLDGLDTFGADLPDEPPERFVPPPPPPLPRLSRQAVLGALAIVAGLFLVLAPGVGPFDRGDSMWLGFAAIMGGAIALILRLRPGTEPGEDQHPDDGARV